LCSFRQFGKKKDDSESVSFRPDLEIAIFHHRCGLSFILHPLSFSSMMRKLKDIEILYAFHFHSLPKNEHETRARFLSRSLEVPKRRTTDRLYRLLGCRGFETRHKEDESQARMGVNGVPQEI